MDNISFQMKELFDAKDYDAVIEFAKNEKEKNDFNEWAYFYLVNSYYKNKDYNNALKVSKEFLRKYKNSDILNDKIGWCLYYTKVKKFDIEKDNIDNLINVVDFIAKRCKQQEYSPYEVVILNLLKIIYNKANTQTNYDLGNKYLELLDPELLSDEERSAEINGRTMKIASQKEQWYNRKIKTLIALKEYEECLKEIDIAFNKIDKFHNKSKEWLKYRQAVCYFCINNIEKADEIIKEILLTFQHWCLYEKLFEIEKVKNNYDEALKYAATAALLNGEDKSKISFYKKVGDYLIENDKIEEGQYHYRLVYLVREEQNWKLDKTIENLITMDEIKSKDKRDVINYLKNFWQECKYNNVIFLNGVIDKIMSNQKSGYILSEEGKSYYFKVNNFVKRVKNIQNGDKVKFTYKDSLDIKKNKISQEAIDIQLISE